MKYTYLKSLIGIVTIAIACVGRVFGNDTSNAMTALNMVNLTKREPAQDLVFRLSGKSQPTLQAVGTNINCPIELSAYRCVFTGSSNNETPSLFRLIEFHYCPGVERQDRWKVKC